MSAKVLILDPCILCVWLEIPGRDQIANKGEARIEHNDVQAKIDSEIKAGVRIVLPLASIIETGNHITQIKGDSHAHVVLFSDFIRKAIRGEQPWDIFRNQQSLFSDEKLLALVDDWEKLGDKGLSMGDTSIKQVAEFYAEQGLDVEIYTADGGLKAYEPIHRVHQLPRNKNRRR